MRKKKTIISLLLGIVLTFNTISTFAADFNSNTDIPVSSTLCITDPESGDTWKWDVPTTQFQSKTRSKSNNETISTVSVDIDISKYLLVY